MPPFAPLQAVDARALGVADDVLDGPFLLPGGDLGLLVSLQGRGGGAMPSPDVVHWGRAVPPRLKREPVLLVLRRPDGFLVLGPMRHARAGQLGRDGFVARFTLEPPLDEATWRRLVDDATAAPPPPPEEGIARLTPHSSTAERLDALRLFVARWWGEASSSSSSLALGPPPLRALHDLGAIGSFCAQNRLIPPGQLVVDDEGHLPFYVENQGVWTWATAAAGDDPPVVVRRSDRATWQPEASSLSTFLLQLLVLEATMGAPFGASTDELPPRAIARLHRQLPLLPLPAWSTSGTRFFGGAGVVGFVQPDGATTSVWLGAKARARLEPVESLIADWPDCRC
jgi:hypothetical protein